MRARGTIRWLIVGIGLWGAAAVPSMAVAESPSESLHLDQLAHTYTTPTAVAAFLRREFTFQRDIELFGEVDRWQRPDEFLSRRMGDCEDYALLARELLVRNWVKAFVFSLYGDGGYAHTVCVFVDALGRYNVINQGTVRYYHATSLEALASALYPGWIFGGITEQTGTQGCFVKEITNVRNHLGRPDPQPGATLGSGT